MMIDLDGTLIGASLEISAADRDAIAKAQDEGVTICLATGRLLDAARPFASELSLRGPIIVLQGSAIYDRADGPLAHCTPLCKATALAAYDSLIERGFHLQLYYGDTMYLDEVDSRARRYIEMSRVVPDVVGDLRSLLNGAAPPGPGPLKLLGIDHHSKVADTIPVLQRELGQRASVFMSQPTYLEVTDPAANKGAALEWVARRLGVALADTAAIGDSDNDIPMLQIAGRSFAVANATRGARSAAQSVVAGQGRNGVAQALAILLWGERDGDG
ncbi:MAG: HAD family phosphatase [Candidatus Eremiobacteraeota bacterium]|nr:HAD family phosphatase [Candidatus Eremiobacteraeota bacterium]